MAVIYECDRCKAQNRSNAPLDIPFPEDEGRFGERRYLPFKISLCANCVYLLGQWLKTPEKKDARDN